MRVTDKIKRFFSLLLIVAMAGGASAPLQAAMIGTDTLMQQEQTRYDREQLTQLLDRESVQQQLQAMGVDVADAKQRVAQMTDSELAQLNGQLGELPAGGDILGIAALIFIVFIITDMMGATDIFTFVHPVK